MSIPLLEAPDLVSIGRMWGLAIIGLSMVPLIGWAGQLSLAQMALAAIGAVAYAHLGWANPLGLVWAGVVAAITAVIIALPVVRLQGIYVALATAAFAVLCDRWLLVLPEFSIGSWSFTVFQGGTLDVVRPDFLGLDLTGPKAYFVYASVVFAVMMLGVVALRRGTYGIRLIATKEGPAAVATAGINVTAIKLSVFAISGFIAGVGGAVLSGASPANNSTFDFVSGLPVLLMMVIGGISSVGAAVITGIFIGSPLVNKILEPVVDFGKWQNVMIGLAGIGLGKNPNGMTSDLRPAGQQVKANRPVLVAMVAALLLVWVLRVADLYGNVLYVVLTLVVLIGSTIIAGLLAEPTGPEHAEAPDGSDVELDDPPELMGLTTPFTAAHREELDQAIGLDAALARVREELADARG
jgi:branched-chain amino acid transport system permease protein